MLFGLQMHFPLFKFRADLSCAVSIIYMGNQGMKAHLYSRFQNEHIIL